MECDDFLSSNLNDFFEKKFSFEKESDWILPSDIVKGDTRWQLNCLDALKQELNSTKSLLNDKGEDWHEHTAKISKSSLVIQSVKKRIKPEILTQAWCKFYEIISNFQLVSDIEHLRSLHLCEAPGAFVSALNYFLCVNHPSITWEWTGNSLNPYYEGHNIRNVIVDDRLIFPTLKNWYFGHDNTGDITDPNYIQDLCSAVGRTGLFHLITADGSVDCLDNPGEQELVVEKLHFAEVLIALSCLAPQGCFILKKFTFFECSSICQIFLLNCSFEKVHVFKPFTSRPSNSEVYVICTGFHGSKVLSDILQQFKDIYSTNNAVAVFSESSIPESFIKQLEDCMKFFTNLQIKAITENLRLYPIQNDFMIERLNDLQKDCADFFVEKYSVCPNSFYSSNKLYFPRKRVLASFSDETSRNQKILYFQAVGDTFNNIMKSTSMPWYDKLLDVERRIVICFPVSRKRSLKTAEWQYPWKEIQQMLKRKTFKSWITLGKKVTCVHNSKFCSPVLLHLWNRISLDDKIHVQSHFKAEHCWNYDILENVFKEEELPISQNIVIVSISKNCSGNDSFLLYLEQNFGFSVNCCLNIDVDTGMSISLKTKTVYINTTLWVTSLNNEFRTKKNLTEAIFLALKIFEKGDSLFLCIQSLLTRYTVGLIFLVISLFDKFITVLPEENAPAGFGQIWIFKNYQANTWANNVIQHLKTITELNFSKEDEILEIVPLTSLCDGPFYSYILDLNKEHLLQRLRNLISVEKHEEEKSS